jgi:hypothetical protein
MLSMIKEDLMKIADGSAVVGAPLSQSVNERGRLEKPRRQKVKRRRNTGASAT